MNPTNWHPHNPDTSRYLRELKLSSRERLTSAFLISTKRNYSFMFMISDLLGRVHGNAESSSPSFSGFSLRSGIPLGFRCQFPVETHRASISVIHLWPFCTLLWITPLVIWTKICGHSLNFPSCGPIILFLLGSEMAQDYSLQMYAYILNGGRRFFFLRSNLGKSSWFEFPVFEVSLSQWIGKHILIFEF